MHIGDRRLRRERERYTHGVLRDTIHRVRWTRFTLKSRLFHYYMWCMGCTFSFSISLPRLCRISFLPMAETTLSCAWQVHDGLDRFVLRPLHFRDNSGRGTSSLALRPPFKCLGSSSKLSPSLPPNLEYVWNRGTRESVVEKVLQHCVFLRSQYTIC